jgi:hypothetical protein
MNKMISRGNKSSERLFPPIRSYFYSTDGFTDLKPKQQSAAKIVGLANKKYTFGQQLFGWNLDAPGKIGRLLLLHKKAVEAEVEGQWRQADFFWEKFYNVLISIYHDESIWEELNTFAFHDIGDDPGYLRQCMMEEVFIDTHCAFYNSRIKKDDELNPKDRVFFHAHYLETLINIAGISPRNFPSLFDPISTARIKVYKREGNWDQAIRIINDFLDHFPDSQKFQSNLALAIHGKIIEELNGGNGIDENSADADSIKRGIEYLEKYREKYSDNIVFYDVMGKLWHLHAIKLNHFAKFSEALISLQKALTFCPYRKEAKKTYKEILETMNQLKAKIEEAEGDIANSCIMLVPDEGFRVKKELSKGSEPADRYKQSKEAKQILESFYIAQTRSVWKELGFAMPSQEQWNEKSINLLNALAFVFENPPQKEADIKHIWEGIAKNNTELEKLDPEVICGYLERCLFKTKKSKNSEDSLQFSNAPIITTPAGEVKQKEEPFMYWFFSRKGIRYHLQIVLLFILIAIVAVIAIKDHKKHLSRDTSFKQITESGKADDFVKIIQGAEKFFSVKPLTKNDEREHYVKKLYDKAILRMFAEQTAELDANALEHFKRYRHLIVDTGK